jgi:hypothetical protein
VGEQPVPRGTTQSRPRQVLSAIATIQLSTRTEFVRLPNDCYPMASM